MTNIFYFFLHSNCLHTLNTTKPQNHLMRCPPDWLQNLVLDGHFLLFFHFLCCHVPWLIKLASRSGHLIECDEKSEIVQYFQGRLCDKIGLLCGKLCDFFRANLHISDTKFTNIRLGKCFIKVRIHCLLYLNLAFFYELCDFPQIVRMRFEVNCAKSHNA